MTVSETIAQTIATEAEMNAETEAKMNVETEDEYECEDECECGCEDIPLIIAFAKENSTPSVMEIVLDVRPETIDTIHNGENALIIAIKQKNTDLAKYLIKKGANTSPVGSTSPFIKAFTTNNYEVMELLVNNGLKVNEFIKNAITYITAVCSLKGCDDDFRKKAIKLLVSAGADVNLKAKFNENTSLIGAIHLKNKCMVEELLTHGADVNMCNKLHETPLMFSCDNGPKDITELLLNSGANPNYQSNNGRTALHIAVKKQLSEHVEMLLDNGADATLKNNTGQTSMDIPLSVKNQKIIELLEKNIKQHTIVTNLMNKKIVKSDDKNKSEEKYKFDVNAVVDGESCVESAIRYGNIEMLYAIFELKPIISNEEKNKLLRLSIKNGKTDMFKFLMEKWC